MIKEKIVRDNSIVQVNSVSKYLEKINNYISAHKRNNMVFVYRGEPEIYSTPCRPNIFRKGVLDSNSLFEKSLFDTMRQNRLTNDKCYLDNAIDAQHGEFPSRLLDVSYNCLVALYFAVTPYYHFLENSLDNKDAMVFLFIIDEIFSPSAKNTNENYEAIINRDIDWFTDKIIFEKNHKFIDHTKLNNRIIAQQGAFILFQGNDASDLPAYMTYGIKIPKEAKAKLRLELKQLFGIYTGSIYPEIVNLADEISEKSKKLNSLSFCCDSEFSYVIKNLEKELSYYSDYLIDCKRNGIDLNHAIIYVENIINSYRIGLLEFYEAYNISKLNENGTRNKILYSLVEAINRYNKVIEEFCKELGSYDVNSISQDELMIIFNGGR